MLVNEIDCHIQFSGVFAKECIPQSTDEWRHAESFGAQCHIDFSPLVTHIVARYDRSDKVIFGKAQGVEVVHITWLYHWYDVSFFS